MTILARTGPPIHSRSYRVLSGLTVVCSEERVSSVVVGNIGTMNLYVVEDSSACRGVQCDKTFPVLLVFEWSIRFETVTHSEVLVLGVKVVEIESTDGPHTQPCTP
jgi:hypothetical protein